MLVWNVQVLCQVIMIVGLFDEALWHLALLSAATFDVLYACPVIALAVLALLYLELTKRFPTK
jgi:hypothetical protein